MSSTFKFHSTVGEAVPWNATYAFPTQATKIHKSIVKIPPKQNTSYRAGGNIKIDFPADGYLNMQNSVLSFDVQWAKSTATRLALQRGGAHNFIKRLVIRYGGLVIEDIREYKTLVRLFTEVGVQKDYSQSFGSILDGMHTDRVGLEETGTPEGAYTAGGATNALLNTQGSAAGAVYDEYYLSGLDCLTLTAAGAALGGPIKRTYCLNLLSGLMTCKKLIPLKWMASQLSLDIYLADDFECVLADAGTPTFTISDVNFIAEMLEFDSSYDKAFYMGLQQGIPLKFSSFHHFQFNLSTSRETLQIHERSRSVKSAYAVVRDNAVPSVLVDSDYFHHGVGTTFTNGIPTSLGGINTYQWRVGGKYYPAQPVRCTQGGPEAMVELLKTVNYLGNYTAAGNIDVRNFTTFNGGKGNKFIMACEFENTDAMPESIAGINAEEQSDIALIIEASGAPGTDGAAKKVDVFTHFDCLLLIKEGNVVDLVL